jgi:hypothetical protein
VSDAYRQAYENAHSTNPTPDAVASAFRIASIASVVITIILAVGIAILAAFDLRGNRVTRIITFVFGGLGVLCLGCSLGGTGLSGRISSTGNSSGGVDTKALTDAVNAARPSWLEPVALTLELIGLLALILVIILLALPAASAFFRKRTDLQGAEPGYPALPYPPVPGAQATEQQVLRPQAPGQPQVQQPQVQQPPADQRPDQPPAPQADQPPAPQADQPPAPPAQ